MILRRVIAHFRKQEWTAIALDFLIVVVGVFIGIQVSNWNAARVDQNALDGRLAALALQLESNLKSIDAHRAQIRSQLDDIVLIRRVLEGEAPVPPDGIDAQLMSMFRVPSLVLNTNAYDEIAETGGLHAITNPLLRSALADWENSLALVRRVDGDTLAYRTGLIDLLTESLALGPMVETFPPVGARAAPVRFQQDLTALKADRRFDNYLAIKIAILTQNEGFCDDLIEDTRRALDLISSEKKKP